MFTLSITIKLAPRVLPVVIATGLSGNTMSVSGGGAIIGGLGTVRGFKTVGVLYASGANALAYSGVMLRGCVGTSNDSSRSQEVLHRTFLGDCFRANLGGLVSGTVLTRMHRRGLRRLARNCAGVSRVPFSFDQHQVSMIVRSRRKGERVVAGKTIRRVLGVYSRTRFGNRMCRLASGLEDGTGEVDSSVGHGKVQMLTVTRGDFVDGTQSFTIASRSRVMLVNCLTFLSPPGPSSTRTVHRLHRCNVRIGVLSNSGSMVIGTVTQRVNVSAYRSMAKIRLRNGSKRRLHRVIKRTALFSELAPLRGDRVVVVLRRGNGAMKFLNSKIGSTKTLERSSVNVSMSSTISVTGRDTSVVLLSGSLDILGRNILRKHGAFNGVAGCVGVATDSGFNGVFDIVFTDTFLPFLPVLPVRLLVRGLLCSVSRAAVPFSQVSTRFLGRPRG